MYLEGLRRTTNTSVRIAGVPADILDRYINLPGEE
jgi:hypothetical protein